MAQLIRKIRLKVKLPLEKLLLLRTQPSNTLFIYYLFICLFIYLTYLVQSVKYIILKKGHKISYKI